VQRGKAKKTFFFRSTTTMHRGIIIVGTLTLVTTIAMLSNLRMLDKVQMGGQEIAMSTEPDGFAALSPATTPASKFTGLPIIVVGMPKVGTTTITNYFQCSGRYKVSHHTCKRGTSGYSKCGVIIKTNVDAGRPPLFGLNFDVYAQLDAWALVNRRLFDYYCYMPQVEDMEKLHTQFPNATFVLNTRNVDHWVKSLHNFNRGNMLGQMIKCNITGLPSGVGRNVADLKKFFEGHTDNIQKFVKSHPSHGLVEIDIEHGEAGKILEEVFGINQTCWGHANKS